MPNDLRDAVAKKDDDKPTDIAERRIRDYEAYVARLAPQFDRVVSSIPKERLTRLAVTAARANPKLTEVTPLSLAGALLTTATLGLEPNTPLGESYLVPYRNHGIQEAQLIVGYQGLTKLFLQHPKAANVWAKAVYPGDEFDYDEGTNPFIHHKRLGNTAEEKGEPHHYYAVVLLTSGASQFEVLTAAEVKELRNGKVGPSGDIPDPQHWMERKTCIRQVLKLAPKTIKLAQAIDADERGGGELYKAMAERGRATHADIDVEVPQIPGQVALEVAGEGVIPPDES